MYKLELNVSEELLKQIKEWKRIAAQYNLSLEELKELTFHIDKIKKLKGGV